MAMATNASEDPEETADKILESPATAAERKRFHTDDAAGLAAAVGIKSKRLNKPTEKFAYFADEERFVVVAGAQEKHSVALAFARGLGIRGDRRLVLVLPERHCFATMQRAPWFKRDARPEIWTYVSGTPVEQTLKTRAQTQEELLKHLKPGQSLQDELEAATRAKHLGEHSAAVWDLEEWATSHQRLDPGHLKGERSWHCMGQKVLSITGTKAALTIKAGVHYSNAKAPVPLIVTGADALTHDQLTQVKVSVEAGITARLDSDDPQIHRVDEHWLQAVIRRDPKLVGVEQPALREFPAWRPRDDVSRKWGRGFIDLMGIDGHGNIRIVETKLAKNADELLIFQGLDYYVWAKVYASEVRQRLAAPPASAIEIHYVIGDDAGKIHISEHAPAQVTALDDDVTWRFQTVRGWYGHPDTTKRATPELLGRKEVPTKGAPT